ncbi:MAG TPA: IS630 family transposase, partial [Desulfocapsa sulfexigens]|nr:IS630 family transposase [Desulfocapsa sulfexigens]
MFGISTILDVYYFDESGFTLEPCIPYAWQDKNETIELPSSKSRRLNVLGFMSHQCDEFESYVVEGSVNSEVVIACIDDFSAKITRKTILVIDNAPTHTSKAFLSKVEEWKENGLIILNIPPYSPELNKIEILWRKIKYEW